MVEPIRILEQRVLLTWPQINTINGIMVHHDGDVCEVEFEHRRNTDVVVLHHHRREGPYEWFVIDKQGEVISTSRPVEELLDEDDFAILAEEASADKPVQINKTIIERGIGGEAGHGSKLTDTLMMLIETSTLNLEEVFAIARACAYADNLPDETIGSNWKQELRDLMKEGSAPK